MSDEEIVEVDPEMLEDEDLFLDDEDDDLGVVADLDEEGGDDFKAGAEIE